MQSDYVQRLRQLAANNQQTVEGNPSPGSPVSLTPRTLALARLAALVAIGASEPSFGEHADAAVGAGASPDEIVDILVGVRPIVGVPRVVAAAPKVALALGHDLDDIVD